MIKDINKIRKELQGFDEVELPFDFKINTKIKYITIKNDEEMFFTGGNYVRMGNNSILLSNGGPEWSVPIEIKNNNSKILYKSRFFIPSKDETPINKRTQEYYEKVIQSQQRVINKMTDIIKKDKQELQKYKHY